MAWEEYQRQQCPGCGGDFSETTHRDNQFAYGGEVIRCHACAARSRTMETFVHDGGDQAGVMYRQTESPNS